jgi:prepilin-type N-terminal cleavage/methylation domain-containing protein
MICNENILKTEHIANLSKMERGFTLIEVIVAMGITAMVTVIFLIALATTGKALLIAQERTIAESISRSQMEYIKDQDYIISEPFNYELIDLSNYPDFSIWSVNGWDESGEATVVAGAVGMAWDVDNNIPATEDNGLQRIMLIIKKGDKDILTLESYKANY